MLVFSGNAPTTTDFAGDVLAVDDRDNPGDFVQRGRVGSVGLVGRGELRANPPAQTSQSPRLKLATVNFVETARGVRPSQFGQPRGILGHHMGLASQDRNHVTLANVVELRQQSVAHGVTPKGLIEIGGVINEGLAANFDKGPQCRSTNVDEWLGGIIHHWGESVETGSPQQIEHHRLSEVIHRVAGQRTDGHDGTSGGPSTRLDVATRLDVDIVDRYLEAESFSEIEHEVGVNVAALTEVMVDVVEVSHEPVLVSEQGQADRVRAPGDGEVDRGAAFGKEAEAQQFCGGGHGVTIRPESPHHFDNGSHLS